MKWKWYYNIFKTVIRTKRIFRRLTCSLHARSRYVHELVVCILLSLCFHWIASDWNLISLWASNGLQVSSSAETWVTTTYHVWSANGVWSSHGFLDRLLYVREQPFAFSRRGAPRLLSMHFGGNAKWKAGVAPQARLFKLTWWEFSWESTSGRSHLSVESLRNERNCRFGDVCNIFQKCKFNCLSALGQFV